MSLSLTIEQLQWDGDVFSMHIILRSKRRLWARIILGGFPDRLADAEAFLRPMADASLRDSRTQHPRWTDNQKTIDLYVELRSRVLAVPESEARRTWENELSTEPPMPQGNR